MEKEQTELRNNEGYLFIKENFYRQLLDIKEIDVTLQEAETLFKQLWAKVSVSPNWGMPVTFKEASNLYNQQFNTRATQEYLYSLLIDHYDYKERMRIKETNV